MGFTGLISPLYKWSYNLIYNWWQGPPCSPPQNFSQKKNLNFEGEVPSPSSSWENGKSKLTKQWKSTFSNIYSIGNTSTNGGCSMAMLVYRSVMKKAPRNVSTPTPSVSTFISLLLSAKLDLWRFELRALWWTASWCWLTGSMVLTDGPGLVRQHSTPHLAQPSKW